MSDVTAKINTCKVQQYRTVRDDANMVHRQLANSNMHDLPVRL